MKTTLISLIGDPFENLYQLGKKEADSFKALEDRVTALLSTNTFLRYGQDILSRARTLMRKKEESFFEDCIAAYAEGLGIEASRYLSFLSLLEIAAHYGQIFPELKGLLPGCTSLFEKTKDGVTHSRLIDFPLLGIFDQKPRLYYWKFEGAPSILSYSCEGLAPLFFQAIHASGTSFALHHKPGKEYHKEGQSIFRIAFETLLAAQNYEEIRKEIRKKKSITKWGIFLLNGEGRVSSIDLEGPSARSESFHLTETNSLIFTNIPLQIEEPAGFESYLSFSHERQTWLKEKLSKKRDKHVLDLMTDIEDQKVRNWIHPVATLSTIGAIHINLTQGLVDIKEGNAALVQSDPIYRISLGNDQQPELIKKERPLTDIEMAWKKASLAQSYFDQGEWDRAYHEIQMSIALMPQPVWKEILSFYLNLWDFKFVTNKKELSLIYKRVSALTPPAQLRAQWLFLRMRLEKRLALSPTVNLSDLPIHLQDLFSKELDSSKPIFLAWMKLLYPRMEILDVFSPHHR
jgi:hypothetical protein